MGCRRRRAASFARPVLVGLRARMCHRQRRAISRRAPWTAVSGIGLRGARAASHAAMAVRAVPAASSAARCMAASSALRCMRRSLAAQDPAQFTAWRPAGVNGRAAPSRAGAADSCARALLCRMPPMVATRARRCRWTSSAMCRHAQSTALYHHGALGLCAQTRAVRATRGEPVLRLLMLRMVAKRARRSQAHANATPMPARRIATSRGSLTGRPAPRHVGRVRKRERALSLTKQLTVAPARAPSPSFSPATKVLVPFTVKCQNGLAGPCAHNHAVVALRSARALYSPKQTTSAVFART